MWDYLDETTRVLGSGVTDARERLAFAHRGEAVAGIGRARCSSISRNSWTTKSMNTRTR